MTGKMKSDGRSATAWAAFASVFLLCGTVAGSAGMARGTKNPVFQDKAAKATPKNITARSEALVVIRYPAVINADAEHAFYQAFGNNAIGGSVPIDVKTRTDTTRVAQALVAKSNYYVMSLYRQLRKALPEHTVLLSPHMIVWDRENGLHSRPLLASEQIPSVLTVDFNVYSYPDIRKIMDSPPLTFGDIVTPLFVVRGNRWLKPATHGLLLSSEPLLQTSWRLSAEQARQQFSNMLNYPGGPDQRPLDFISFIGTRNAVPVLIPQMGVGSVQREVSAVEVYPLEKVQMNPDWVSRINEDPSTDPFAEGFVKGAAARILELLDSVDQDRALFFSRQVALQRFDPELAGVFLTGSKDESVRSRLQLAEALIEAERTFLSGQSESVFQGTFNGDYGQKMREMIQAEFGMLEERRRLSRIQNVTTALTVAMLAGSVYGTSVSGTVVASALQNITPVFVLGSIWSARTALKTRARAGTVTEKFMALMAPDLDQQISVQTEWMESKEEITARGFAEFRDKTTALYQSRVRSLNSRVDEHCIFRHPQIAAPGRWIGQCANGLASARGYGLVRDEVGNSVEYLGDTESGSASGTGGMIVQLADRATPVYYEGKFRKGLPDGVVAVEKNGERTSLRTFKAGVDVGKASEKQWKRLQF